MRKFFFAGFIIVIIFLSAAVFSTRNSTDQAYRVIQYEFLEDANSDYSFETVSSANFTSRFTPYPYNTIALGITRSAYWFRIPTPSNPAYHLIQFNNANINNIDVFIPSDNGYVHKAGGVNSPAARDIWDTTLVFSLNDHYQQNSYLYFRLESTSALRLGVAFWSTDAFISDAFAKNIGFGGFYGILLAMLFLNLFSFFILRDKAYFFYVLYIGFMLVYQLQVQGHFRWLLNIPYPTYNAFFWVCLALAYIAAIFFTCSFLQVHRQTPRWNKVMGFLIGLAILQGALGMSGANIPANQLAHILGLAEPLVIMALAITKLRQGFEPAKYFLLAWGVLSTGIIIWALSAYIPGMTLAVNFLLVATATESILLTFALADRFRSLRQQAKHAQYYRDLSLTDELTGLYNKRYLKEKFKQEIDFALRNDKPLSLMIIDVDHFKEYNDRHGHLAGDQVLNHLGGILLNNLDDAQVAFRFGGEEYVILLPETNCDQAMIIAENLRLIIQNEKIVINSKATAITVSIGVSELRKDDNYNKLFQRMDEALYVAKSTGRNRIVYA